MYWLACTIVLYMEHVFSCQGPYYLGQVLGTVGYGYTGLDKTKMFRLNVQIFSYPLV